MSLIILFLSLILANLLQEIIRLFFTFKTPKRVQIRFQKWHTSSQINCLTNWVILYAIVLLAHTTFKERSKYICELVKVLACEIIGLNYSND